MSDNKPIRINMPVQVTVAPGQVVYFVDAQGNRDYYTAVLSAEAEGRCEACQMASSREECCAVDCTPREKVHLYFVRTHQVDVDGVLII